MEKRLEDGLQEIHAERRGEYMSKKTGVTTKGQVKQAILELHSKGETVRIENIRKITGGSNILIQRLKDELLLDCLLQNGNIADTINPTAFEYLQHAVADLLEFKKEVESHLHSITPHKRAKTEPEVKTEVINLAIKGLESGRTKADLARELGKKFDLNESTVRDWLESITIT